MAKLTCTWIAVVAASAMCASAHAASFNCKLAKTPQEKAICATPALSTLDEQMAAAYQAWVKFAPADIKVEALASQKAWLGTLSSCPTGATLVSCLTEAYNARITALKENVVTMGGVTFVMHDKIVMVKDAADDGVVYGEQNAGYGTLEASWPVALRTSPEWKKWNTAVEQAAKLQAGADAKSVSAPWAKAWAGEIDATLDTQINVVDAKHISVWLEYNTTGHGTAHNSESGENFTWMLAAGRVMQVSDILKPGWAAVVNAYCVADLKTQDIAAYNDLAGSVASVTASMENMSITADGLDVAFPEYSVAPRATPVGDVVVPWDKLKPFFVAGFVPPTQ